MPLYLWACCNQRTTCGQSLGLVSANPNCKAMKESIFEYTSARGDIGKEDEKAIVAGASLYSATVTMIIHCGAMVFPIKGRDAVIYL